MAETDYEIIFRHRGFSYNKAMTDFPRVRTLEFQNLFSRLPLKGGERIIDCPALGGYLSENIDTRVKVESLDFCPQEDKVKPLKNFTPKEKSDRVVCLASSHHIDDLTGFLKQLTTFLKTGGYLHLADVDYNSPIRLFLDNFVGEWTSTGHEGIWRNLAESALFGFTSELDLLQVEERACPWTFKTMEQMINFCRLLFGLDLNPSDQQVLEALENYVGIDYSANSYNILWKLTYVDLIKHG
jgi:hypothetical protein